MSDSAFRSPPYAGCTTKQLNAAIMAGNGTDRMVAEIERRAKRDAGDVSVMFPGERLRHAQANPDWKWEPAS